MRKPGSVRDTTTRLAGRLPARVRDPLRTFVRRPSVWRRLPPPLWGNLRRTEPFSRRYGFDRGTPIDRRYLACFFDAMADDIHGRVLEVKDPVFSARYGRGVGSIDIVDIDAGNPLATIVADLAGPGSLPPGSFDCAIVPQTLHLVSDPGAALANLWASLADGGVMLVTVPTIAKVDHEFPTVDRWRFTPRGMALLLDRSCPGADVEVVAYGNVLSAVAFLFGLAADELRPHELDRSDPSFPMLTCARARRPSR
ncbi:MAG: methyltransferase [Acidimicrobiia bacterium]|nr:methyltransferase [Acidimicrobiia bacterium]